MRTDAYYVLSNSTRRSNYDAQRAHAGPSGFTGSTSPDASAEYFANFFRSAFTNAQQQQQQGTESESESEDEQEQRPPGGFGQNNRPDPEATLCVIALPLPYRTNMTSKAATCLKIYSGQKYNGMCLYGHGLELQVRTRPFLCVEAQTFHRYLRLLDISQLLTTTQLAL